MSTTVSNMMRAPSCTNWPMECRSVEKITLAGNRPFWSLPSALAEKLFVPLVHHREIRLIASHQFHALSLAVQDIARRSIAVAFILRAAHGQFLPCFGGARHQRVDVAAAAAMGSHDLDGLGKLLDELNVLAGDGVKVVVTVSADMDVLPESVKKYA